MAQALNKVKFLSKSFVVRVEVAINESFHNQYELCLLVLDNSHFTFSAFGKEHQCFESVYCLHSFHFSVTLLGSFSEVSTIFIMFVQKHD